MFKYKIEVWEPAIDPGGYQGCFSIEAENDETAKKLALQRGNFLWPANTGLLTQITTKDLINET